MIPAIQKSDVAMIPTIQKSEITLKA